jgi:hypothetical protein
MVGRLSTKHWDSQVFLAGKLFRTAPGSSTQRGLAYPHLNVCRGAGYSLHQVPATCGDCPLHRWHEHEHPEIMGQKIATFTFQEVGKFIGLKVMRTANPGRIGRFKCYVVLTFSCREVLRPTLPQ